MRGALLHHLDFLSLPLLNGVVQSQKEQGGEENGRDDKGQPDHPVSIQREEVGSQGSATSLQTNHQNTQRAHPLHVVSLPDLRGLQATTHKKRILLRKNDSEWLIRINQVAWQHDAIPFFFQSQFERRDTNVIFLFIDLGHMTFEKRLKKKRKRKRRTHPVNHDSNGRNHQAHTRSSRRRKKKESMNRKYEKKLGQRHSHAHKKKKRKEVFPYNP